MARALRDAGMEVVYGGLHRTPEQVAKIAIDEDVDVVGVSILSGAHLTLVPILADRLRQDGADDIAIVCGGIIPDEDRAVLLEMGVAAVVDQEATLDEVVAAVNRAVYRDRARSTSP